MRQLAASVTSSFRAHFFARHKAGQDVLAEVVVLGTTEVLI